MCGVSTAAWAACNIRLEFLQLAQHYNCPENKVPKAAIYLVGAHLAQGFLARNAANLRDRRRTNRTDLCIPETGSLRLRRYKLSTPTPARSGRERRHSASAIGAGSRLTPAHHDASSP